MSKPKVDQELCIGCGTCEALCPEIFKVEDEKSVVIGEDCEKVGCNCDEIVVSCPVNAISME
ncbi:MAG: ferredoxin [Parcubacteria group bacterium]|jgi:ferredoxin